MTPDAFWDINHRFFFFFIGKIKGKYHPHYTQKHEKIFTTITNNNEYNLFELTNISFMYKPSCNDMSAKMSISSMTLFIKS